MKELIIGAGEIGTALGKILGIKNIIDINQKDNAICHDFMHICFPYSKDFCKEVLKYMRIYNPKIVIIHSTILPETTELLQSIAIATPIVISPMRCVHKRMLKDIYHYTKFIASSDKSALAKVKKRFEKARLKVKIISNPKTLEYAKIICDTSYYHLLIAYSQWTHLLCEKEGMNYDELWQFADEIHKKLGNRPRMFFDAKGIGGHCVLQNTDLLNKKLNDELLAWMLKTNKRIKHED